MSDNDQKRRSPVIRHRVDGLEEDLEGVESKCDRILNTLGEIKISLSSLTEAADRHQHRLEDLDERVDDVEKKIWKWAVPMGVLITVITIGGGAAMTGVDLSTFVESMEGLP